MSDFRKLDKLGRRAEAMAYGRWRAFARARGLLQRF